MILWPREPCETRQNSHRIDQALQSVPAHSNTIYKCLEPFKINIPAIACITIIRTKQELNAGVCDLF